MANSQNHLLVFAEDDIYRERADELAKRLGIGIARSSEEAESARLALRIDERGLALTGQGLELRGDFTKMFKRLRPNELNREMLVKAAKIKGLDRTPTLIDATAGLGEDSMLLAAAGFSVRLYEYDPVIAALLDDAMRRAADVPELAEIAARMTLLREDSIRALNELDEASDVILLDPMFPARTKSALVKKKFQLLQQLESPCSDEEELVRAAIKAHPKKIVIKRPLKGPQLAGIKPSYSLTGKAIRYDCIVLA